VQGGTSRDWEWHAPDPPYFTRVPGSTTFSAPSRHSNFWRDPSGIFQLAVIDLLAQVDAETAPPGDGTGATDTDEP
jgi:hypothetical protein